MKQTCWKGLTLVLFVLICIHLFFLSNEVIYRGLIPGDKYNATFEIDVCYRSFIGQDSCNSLEDPSRSGKKEFTCNFEDRIGCYTKDLEHQNVSQILSQFRSCGIVDLVQVQNETENVTKTGEELLLFNGFICVKHKFQIHEKEENSQFSISTTQKNQPFKVYATYSRDYETDGRYKTKSSHLFERACWVEDQNLPWNKSLNCTELGKEIVFDVEYYSAKYLEHPFRTDCVYRKNSNQNDCYESCVKKKTPYHLLTYHEKENVRLEFGKRVGLKAILDDCAESCRREDCNTMILHTPDIHEESNSANQMTLNLVSGDYRREAIALISIPKLVWMILAFASIFFGVNFYGMLIKKSQLPSNFQNFAIIRSKNRRIKYKKRLATTIAVAALSLSLGLVLEKIFFDFGRDENRTFLRKDSLDERSVSVSVCFDLCKIIKKEANIPQDKCNEEMLMQKTIRELDEMTWNAGDFKKVASVRTNARPYPIRQDEFSIPRFFRDLKKCFLIQYEAKNYWPHYSIQRYSKIYINIDGDVPHTHFFIEDGEDAENYPEIRSTPTKISVLHSVVLIKRRLRDGCVDYMASTGKSRDRLVRQCVIEESLKRNNGKGIPVQVTLRVDDYRPSWSRSDQSYPSLKFYNDSDLFKDSLKFCRKEYERDECSHSYTYLTHQDLSKTGQIQINLTPYLYERKPFEDENGLIVANRIFSFLVIFVGVSVKELSNAVLSAYFLNLFPLHNVHLSKRLFQLALSLLFLLNFCSLYHAIVYHRMIETSAVHQTTEIEPLGLIRFCFPTNVDLNSDNSYKLKDLNLKTLDFSEIFENVLIFDDYSKISTNLTMFDYKLERENGTSISPRHLTWTARANDRLFQAFFIYLDRLKCYTFFFESLKNKTERNLNVHYHRLQKLFTISLSLRNLNESRIQEGHQPRFYIFLNRKYALNFDWNKQFGYGEYAFDFSIVKRRYQDDFWYLKNPLSSLNLIGLSKLIDNPVTYLNNLRDSFANEQYCMTTYIPLFPGDERGLFIKNRQFDYYVQFRSLATKRNEKDFTKNAETMMVMNTVYLKKKIHNADRILLRISARSSRFQENSRNRYRFVELFLHLFTLASFWFKVDFITLPTSLQKAYPLMKYFVVHFLYYVVSFFVYIFDLWFAFVRFLKFKEE